MSSNGISFSDLCMVLYERCPHLEELYIENCMLNGTTTNYYVDDYIICGPTKNLIFQKGVLKEYRPRRELLFLPKSLRLLSFRNSMFEDDLLLFSITSADHFSNLEVLDFTETWVHEQARGKYVFSKYDGLRELYLPHCKFLKNGMNSLAKVLPHLQILNLAYATVRKFDLNSLQYFGDNLVEIYFCGIPIRDDNDLTCLQKGAFPKVKVMCFQGSVVRQRIAKRLFDCCRVLEIVYAIFPADDTGNIRIGYYERQPGNISFLHADNACKMHSSKVKYHINAT